jgi:hypothetical protein
MSEDSSRATSKRPEKHSQKASEGGVELGERWEGGVELGERSEWCRSIFTQRCTRLSR